MWFVSPRPGRAAGPALLPAVALLALSCGGGKAPAGPAPARAPSPAERFASASASFYRRYLELSPVYAVDLGHHEFDGVLPDVSTAGLAAHAAWLREQRALFESIPADEIDGDAAIDRDIILSVVRGDLFDLEVARTPMVSPLVYLDSLDLTDYISRDYAPLADRARAVVAIGKGAKAFLAAAQANLPEAMPRTWIDTALLRVDGLVEFAYKDVVEALAPLSDAALSAEVGASLPAYAAALTAYRDFLTARQASANDDFALGAERFLRMLADKEGVSIDLDRLEAIGRADLDLNLAALAAAAAELAPGKSTAQVIEQVRQDKPDADAVIAEATAQATAMRAFLLDKQIVTIPSEDAAEVRPTPPFMRWNFAFLSAPGVFETKPLPAFYYISPPDPKWSKKDQRDYVPNRGNLLYTTIHEVWPGHFLHYLHQKRVPSHIRRSFCSYATVEGWAHYAEEMMNQAGASAGQPGLAMGQLTSALLRDARFLSAIGLHTRGMKLEESIALFEEKAFASKPTARQQAVRGTFDPGYLNYTLGKLMIRKLREDWKAKAGADFSLQAFHDRFLSYGCAPVPVIRRAMLGPDAGPAL